MQQVSEWDLAPFICVTRRVLLPVLPGLRTGPDSVFSAAWNSTSSVQEKTNVEVVKVRNYVVKNVLKLVMEVQGFFRVCSCKAECAHSVPALACFGLRFGTFAIPANFVGLFIPTATRKQRFLGIQSAISNLPFDLHENVAFLRKAGVK